MPLGSGWMFSRFTRLMAGCLVLSVVQEPFLLAAPVPGWHAKKTTAAKSITEEERATHALNRLTFGPKPGDLERVQAIGVKKWVEMQLNPEQIDDSLLEARLQSFPAMHLSQQDLIQTFPSAGVIRAVADGRIPLPKDRVEHAIYQNQVFAYEERRQKQAQEAAKQPAGEPVAAPAPNQMAGNESLMADAMALEDVASSPSIAVHEQKLSADLASTQIVNRSPDQRLQSLVGMKPGQLRGFMKELTPEERSQLTAGMTPQQKETVVALLNPTLLVAGELLQTRLLTDLYSQRQLQAVMTDFWLNHFNVYLKKGQLAPWYLVDEQNVVAPHAMGKFEDLLVATAKSPAMLFYLDNHTSIGPRSMAAMRAQLNPQAKNKSPGLNENYARELMELHTLGVDAGYTQKDVTEVAKVFTGWTIGEPRKGGGFTFNERRHEPGPKVVMGKTIQENGEQEGLEVLHRLATNPATAHHLSRQLAERFVSDTPPPALVDRMAKTYLRSDGDIRQVLRTLFTSPEFWSRDAYRAKVKTPEEFVLSAVRATGGQVDRPAIVLNAMGQLGMPFYGCQTPNGYSWTAGAWVNSGDLLTRINIALALAGHKLGTATDLDALMKIKGPDAASAAQKEARLEAIFLNGELNPQARQTVLQQADALAVQGPIALPAAEPFKPGSKQAGTMPVRAAFVQVMDSATPIPAPADKQAALVAGLLLGSPDFQKR
ncbi:MAG: hypothetical protein QOJ51_3793 [Acidobacteriaceae bacterium]|nr:hypothetical protein [Acidobacteriaceae bacterium]